ncbi:hypothetical protein pb186bvf_018127 [Paramecium bursaria]
MKKSHRQKKWPININFRRHIQNQQGLKFKADKEVKTNMKTINQSLKQRRIKIASFQVQYRIELS